MTRTPRESGSSAPFHVGIATLLLVALGGCGALPTPIVATGVVDFQEMRFILPAGQWVRSPGSPPSSQVLFTLSQDGGRAQTLSIWRVSYPKNMYGLAPEVHTTNIWNYEQFEKPRPSGPWVGFERSKRSIAGKEYPVMSYRWHHPGASNPQVEAHGIFLAYFPDDFRNRERFYIFQWEDAHPPGGSQQGWEWLDQVVSGFTLGPVQDRTAGPGTDTGMSASDYYSRGVSYHRKGQYDQAISDYDKALEVTERDKMTSSQSALVYENRASAYSSKGQGNQAISDFSKALELNPRSLLAYYNRGHSYAAIGQYDQAISDYDKAIEVAERDNITHRREYSLTLVNRGFAYQRKGLYERSLSDFDKAIKLEPRYYEAHYYKAIAHEHAGQTREALEAYRGFMRYVTPTANAALVERARQRIKELEK